MRSMQGRWALVCALVAAFLAAWLHIRYLQGLQATEQVVMVNEEVLAFTPVPAGALTVREVPAGAYPRDVLRLPAEASGRYARTLLVPGTALRRSHLIEAEGSRLAARLTHEGSAEDRAMALEVSPATGVAGTLTQGDRVDVLVSVRLEQERVRESMARIIARNVPVLDVKRDEAGRGVVVLQMPAKVAEEVAFAQISGTIWLLTTPFGTGAQPTPGVTMASFLAKYGVQAAEVDGEPWPGPQAAVGAAETHSGRTGP